MAYITQPGKFEGEQEYVPYFYELMLNGGPDRERRNCVGMDVLPEDKVKFSELKRRKVIWLWLRDDGFVQEV